MQLRVVKKRNNKCIQEEGVRIRKTKVRGGAVSSARDQAATRLLTFYRGEKRVSREKKRKEEEE